MSIVLERFNFLLNTRSERDVSRETMIPRSTLYDFKKGIRDLPEKYKTTLYNTYRREVYNTGRETGMSVSVARRFSWSTPKVATYALDRIESVLKERSLVATEIRVHNLKELGKPYNYGSILHGITDSIRTAMSRTEQDWEDWLKRIDS